MTEKRKNIKFLICQIVVAILGLVWIIVRGNTVLLSAYIPIMVIVIPATYFNYTLCKLEKQVAFHVARTHPLRRRAQRFSTAHG